jgi:cytochrome c oxidase assembly protein Cox11
VIPVDANYSVFVDVTGVGETSTLALPTYTGQKMVFYCATLGGGGDRTVAVANDINVANNSNFQFTAIHQNIVLEAMATDAVGGLVWTLTHNDGATLS